MNWKNNEHTDFWRKYIVNELLALHSRLMSKHEHGPYGSSVSRKDAESEDFQRFLSVLRMIADSQSALEFKMNCEMFGRDPKEDFDFCLRFALDVFTNEFEYDCWEVPPGSIICTSAVTTNRILRSAENFEYEEFFEIRADEKEEKKEDV